MRRAEIFCSFLRYKLLEQLRNENVIELGDTTRGSQSLINGNNLNWKSLIRAISLIFSVSLLGISGVASAAKPNKPTPDNNNYPPMVLEYDDYNFRNLSGDNSCLGEDDALEWRATGSLAPGESFTYTPEVPGCYLNAHAISAVLSWEGSELEMSSVVPGNDYTSGDLSQQGKQINARKFNNTSQLCMFPVFDDGDAYYTITVTNVGNSTATNIILDGESKNDWAIFYYNRCLNADADQDGWNDSFEHSMSQLVYPVVDIEGVYEPFFLWGSNYLKDVADTPVADDEVDSYPPDFNDDKVVDYSDLDEISAFLGEGNGITMEEISPDAYIPEWFHYNQFQWRRYDLDADGYVTQTDVDIVEKLIGQPIPMLDDIIEPTARVTLPLSGEIVPRGEYYRIRGHVWDNMAVSRVEYLVDGKTICSVTDPVPDFGFTSPFYACWWKTPKKRGQFDIAIRVSDASGNMATSEIVSVIAD